MKLLLSGLSIFLLSSSLKAPCFASPSPASEQVTSPVPTIASTLPDIIQWELTLAENKFKLRTDHEARSELITPLEKAVQITCMKDLPRTLSYKSPPDSAECQEYIKRLVEIDPKNPQAICARSGIDSAECKEGYLSQSVRSFVDSSLRSSDKALVGNLEEILESKRSTASLEDLRRQITEGLRQMKKAKPDKKVEKTLEVRALILKGLQQSCTRYRIVLNPDTLEGSTQAKNAHEENEGGVSGIFVDKKKGKSLDELLLNELEGSKSARSSREYEATRYRVIAPECDTMIEKAFDFEKDFAPAVCARDGNYSPSCIAARRKEARTNPTGTSATKTRPSSSRSGSGLETF